jgi:hypothetical protein
MKRALRRYHQRVARARWVRILRTHGAWREPCPVFENEWNWEPKVWRPARKLVMNEPGYWTHEMIIQPSRVRTNQLLQKVYQGVDAEGVVWPDYHKPHVYYW